MNLGFESIIQEFVHFIFISKQKKLKIKITDYEQMTVTAEQINVLELLKKIAIIRRSKVTVYEDLHDLSQTIIIYKEGITPDNDDEIELN
jgi:hypothetical protein